MAWWNAACKCRKCSFVRWMKAGLHSVRFFVLFSGTDRISCKTWKPLVSKTLLNTISWKNNESLCIQFPITLATLFSFSLSRLPFWPEICININKCHVHFGPVVISWAVWWTGILCRVCPSSRPMTAADGHKSAELILSECTDNKTTSMLFK